MIMDILEILLCLFGMVFCAFAICYVRYRARVDAQFSGGIDPFVELAKARDDLVSEATKPLIHVIDRINRTLTLRKSLNLHPGFTFTEDELKNDELHALATKFTKGKR